MTKHLMTKHFILENLLFLQSVTFVSTQDGLLNQRLLAQTSFGLAEAFQHFMADAIALLVHRPSANLKWIKVQNTFVPTALCFINLKLQLLVVSKE